MIKLVFGSKNKIIKHDKRNFEQLRETIRSNFPDVPTDYSLSYLDQDKDQICLNSDEDLLNMFNAKLKTYKVYIKQSLSQTINLDIDHSQSFEPSFDNSISMQIEKEEKGIKIQVDQLEVAFKKEVKRQEQPKQDEQVPLKKQQIPIAQPVKQQVRAQPIIHLKLQGKSQLKKEIEKVQQKNEQIVINQEKVVKQEVKQIKNDIVNEIEAKVQQKLQSEEPHKFRDIVRQNTDVSEVFQLEVIRPKDQIPCRAQPQKFQISDAKRTVSKIKIAKPAKPLPIFQEQKIQQKNMKKQKDFFDKLFEKQQVVHKEIQVAPEVHGIICSKCHDEFGILGIRYQCILCFNYNLCSVCEATVDHEHSLLKVKLAKKAINRDFLLEHFRKELKAMEQSNVLPAGYYVPSISKQESQKIIEAARQAYEVGIVRSQKLMNDLYFKLEMSHKNPYELKKPVEKIQAPEVKAKYLSQMVGISYLEALKFCQKYPFFNKEKTAEEYLTKNLNK